MPHIHCYLEKPALVWTMFITDLLIGVAYVGISITLWWLIKKIKVPYSLIVLCFGVFIAACGATHFMEIYTLWQPQYWIAASIKVITAAASVGTGIYLYQLRHPLVLIAQAAKLSEQRRIDLESLTRSLEQRVDKRTIDLKNALEIRDGFLSVASHELRTPITSLKLKVAINRKAFAAQSDTKALHFANEVESQLDRLSKLVDDMLDISKVKAGTLSMIPENFALSDLVTKILERHAPEFQKSNTPISTELDATIQISADPVRVEQVFNNLIDNAIRYAPGAAVHVSTRQTKDLVQLIVQDAGPGVSPANAFRIFERFERLHPNHHSSGLGVGLYLSKAIMAAHQGSIFVEPSTQGARFIVEFPKNLDHSQTPKGISLV